MIDPGLSGKVVLVTGANNPYGIGAAVAKALAEQGAKVLVHGKASAAVRKIIIAILYIAMVLNWLRDRKRPR